MLSTMRENASSWIIKILLGAVIVVFVLSYGVMRDRGRRVTIAKVNGEVIYLDEYQKAYNNLLEQMRQRFKGNFNEEMVKMFQLEKQTIEGLVSERLLTQEAERLGFRVGNAELADSIINIGAFQTNGQFDKRAYGAVLNRNNLTPESFEAIQRQALLLKKIRSFITSSIKVSDVEAMAWYQWNGAMVDMDYVLFEPDSYKDITPTEEEIKTYFDAHKNAYKSEPRVKAQYIQFDPEDYKVKVKITDEDIRAYYESYPEQFRTPETVEARHILLKLEQNAPPETVETVRKKALEIMEMARKGTNFAELAKKYSQGPTQSKGGYLGTFEKKTMVKPFSDKAFSMAAGEISEPVRTPYGWHIIKVEKVNEAVTRSLESAAGEIRKQLTDDRAKTLAAEAADKAFYASFEGEDLAKTFKDTDYKIMTTGFFTKNNLAKGVKDPARFTTTAFELPVLGISDILEFGNLYCILQVMEKTPETIPPLESIKPRVVVDLKRQTQEDSAKKDAETLLADVKSGKSLSEGCQKYNLKSSATGFFKRTGAIPFLGYEREISEAAFGLSSRKPLPEKVFKGEKGYYLIRFKEKKEPDPAGFEKEKENIRKNLLQQKRFKTLDAWLQKIREKSDVFVDDTIIKT